MSRYDEQYFGIKVTLPDGSYDWYDPCDKEPYTTDEGITIVENTRYSYEFIVPITWEEYPLCSECLHEVEVDTGYCSSECKYNYVMEE